MNKIRLHAQPPADMDVKDTEITMSSGYEYDLNLRFLKAAAAGLRSDGWIVRISEHKEVEEVLE